MEKAKPKERMRTEITDTGNSSKTPGACRREAEEHKMKTAVEHGGSQIEQARPLETTLSDATTFAKRLASCSAAALICTMTYL
jgi:hypothetical protein